MLLGYDAYGYKEGSSFSTTGALSDFYRCDLSNAIIDDINVDEDTTKSFSTVKETTWDYQTVLNCDFLGNLSGGSLNNNAISIEKIKFCRRRKDTLIWTPIKIIDFDKDVEIYSFIDYIPESATKYEYAVFPVTSGVSGSPVTTSITTEFEGTYICDKSNTYRLLYNLSYSDIEHITGETTIETADQYPTTIFSSLDYRKSGLKSLLVSATTINNNDGTFDASAEKAYRDAILKFLKNKKPKILKNDAGDYILVSLSNVKESRDSSFSNIKGDISFNFTEIGNAQDIKTLQNAGLSV